MIGKLAARPLPRLRAAAGRPGRVRAAGRAARSVRARPAARRRLPDDVDDSLVRHGGPRARRGARVGSSTESSSCARRGPDYVLRHVHGGRGGLRHRATRSPRPSASSVWRARVERRSSCPSATCTTPRRSGSALLQGLLDTDGGPVASADAPAASSTTTAPTGCATTSSSWSARSAASPTRAPGSAEGRRPDSRSAVPCTTGTTRYILDIRLPPASQPFRLDAQAAAPTTPRAAGGRCASSTASSRRARRRRVCIQVGRAGLAVRDRRLPRHAQHPQRRVRHPRRGAEHHRRADEDVPHPARVRLEDRRHRRRHPGRPAGRRAERAADRPRDPRRHRRRALLAC